MIFPAGFIIYFTYGLRNSVQGKKDKIEKQELVERNGSYNKKLAEATSNIG